MAAVESLLRARVVLCSLACLAVIGAGCGGRPEGPASSPIRDVPGAAGAPTALVTPASASATTPATSPSDSAAPSATAAPTAATAKPTLPTAGVTAKPATGEGSLRLALTEPIDVDVTLPADVDCDVGRSYHMFTGVEVDGDGVEVTVDIALYHGPDDYRALVRVMVSTPSGTQGGEIPGVPVTITSDTKGRAEFSYSGANGSVDGKVVWTCSP